MDCFCEDQFLNNYTTFWEIDFEEIDGQAVDYDCSDWALAKSLNLAVFFTSSFSVVFINFVC